VSQSQLRLGGHGCGAFVVVVVVVVAAVVLFLGAAVVMGIGPALRA
jgi:hypothetical protein